MKNAFTVDVEDYFQVAAFDKVISRSDWDSIDARVETNVQRMLSLLASANVRATFFTLGWVAKRFPGLVREIVANGHELANHGYSHIKVTDQDAEQFREDVYKSRMLLEQISGKPVVGYRAPSFSIDKSSHWAHDVLVQTGHRYSSSIYPIRHDHFGVPDGHRFPYTPTSGLVEIPATSVRLARNNYPAAGGGYFRLLPYAVSKRAIEIVNSRDSSPAIFYCHPWEIDPEQPRVPGAGLKSRFRHYVNLSRTERRIVRLLTDFSWGRMDEVFACQISKR